jgi:hypothetical protein
MPKNVRTPFTAAQVQEIETLVGFGSTVVQMASFFGISKRTFERRCKYSPGALDALEKGRFKANTAVIQTAYQLAISGKVPAMTMFWLKCRVGWSELGPKDDSQVRGEKQEVYETQWGGHDSEENPAPVQSDRTAKTD